MKMDNTTQPAGSSPFGLAYTADATAHSVQKNRSRNSMIYTSVLGLRRCIFIPMPTRTISGCLGAACGGGRAAYECRSRYEPWRLRQICCAIP